LTLISLTGAFGGNTDTSICDAYRAELKRIADANAILQANYNIAYQAYLPKYEAWLIELKTYRENFWDSNRDSCKSHLFV
jgi:hypothetical protein